MKNNKQLPLFGFDVSHYSKTLDPVICRMVDPPDFIMDETLYLRIGAVLSYNIDTGDNVVILCHVDN
jgi:hypothetical protein